MPPPYLLVILHLPITLLARLSSLLFPFLLLSHSLFIIVVISFFRRIHQLLLYSLSLLISPVSFFLYPALFIGYSRAIHPPESTIIMAPSEFQVEKVAIIGAGKIPLSDPVYELH